MQSSIKALPLDSLNQHVFQYNLQEERVCVI